jgi:thiol-disulfide isomerase/thioredoxin
MKRRSNRAARNPFLKYYAAGLIGFVFLWLAVLRLTPPVRDLSRNPLVTQAAYFQDGPKLDFEGGIAWINTAGPIRIEDLRGKIVLLDFWTYCCINCHHVLPDLERLEQKYAKELVVIGVHSAKFPAERDTDNIRRKVAEYRIKHPVINDADMILWRKFGVNSWPTFVLLDANGRYVGFASGEGQYELLDKAIGQLIAKHKEKDELNETPLQFFPENEKSYDQPLLYPGKVHVNAAANRLFVTDTGHNRIVVADLDGNVVDVIGNGRTGFTNGTFQETTFNRPQGVYMKDDILLIADTENHAIRAADLKNKTVKTVAGTGVQSYRREGSGKADITGLNSPWDIVPFKVGNRFAIAMAGPHQIWELNLDKDTVGQLAGSGREDIIDGTFKAAALAQPSGLASDGENIFFADSETSSLRFLNLKKNTVETVVGKGLFDFSDTVGPVGKGRYYFQHCLGVAYDDGFVYVADSYNNRIKAYDVKGRKIVNVVGTGQAGSEDNGAQSTFYQPGGIAVAGGKLYVADTNNHAIRVADLKSGEVSTLTLKGLTKPEEPVVPPSFPNAQVIRVADAKVAPEKALNLDIRLPIDKDMKLTPEAPLPYTVEVTDAEGKRLGGTSVGGGQIEPPAEAFSTTLTLDQPLEAGKNVTMKVSVAAFLCKDGAEGFCLPKSYIWEVPMTVAADGSNRVSLGAAAPAK